MHIEDHLNFRGTLSRSKKLHYFIHIVCLLTIGSVLLSSSTFRSNDLTKKKPNVLFIFVDDLRPELGSYGKKFAITPHIDKFSSRAVVFKNHFVSVPTCGASRASLLTGRVPRKLADLSNNVFETRLLDHATQHNLEPESFIEQFRRNGYKTVGIGKISHAADGFIYKYLDAKSNQPELPKSWDELLFDPGIWKTGWNAFFGYADGSNRNALSGMVKPYEAADVDDEGYPDGLTASLAVEKLKELSSQGKPFFLGVGFFKPHLPFNAPKKYWDLYDPEEIPTSPFTEIPEGMNVKSLHQSAEFNSYRQGEEKGTLEKSVSEAYAKKIRHAYMASVSYVDAQIGKVLDALQAAGLEKNTLVVLWGDHGWHLGDDRVWGKHTLTEWSLKSPLIISLPNQTKTIIRNEVVGTIDIYPTLMNLAEIDLPGSLDGKTLLPLMNMKKNTKWDQRAWGYFNQGVTMRTARYRVTKYLRNGKTEVELYDHAIDPFETKNRAKDDPALAASMLKELESKNIGLF